MTGSEFKTFSLVWIDAQIDTTETSTNNQPSQNLRWSRAMSRIRYVSFCTRLTYSKKSNETDKQQLIALYKKNYQDSERNLRIVNEFEQKYTSDKALWWYTRESFLYRMLNKALRVQNIDLLFLFRFVIGDTWQQLKQNQCQSSVRVLRG